MSVFEKYVSAGRTKDFVTEVLLLKDSQIFRSASKTEPID